VELRGAQHRLRRATPLALLSQSFAQGEVLRAWKPDRGLLGEGGHSVTGPWSLCDRPFALP
jgi:hypothetical protein